jgi:methenyltetrahydrofolate cyclohydrolase
MLSTLPLSDFLNETASSSPAPGGGSISALAASLGTALASMVCRLTIGKKKYEDVQSEMENILMQTEALRPQFMALIDEDTSAFNNVMAAYGLPKETDEQKANRRAEIQAAMKTATLVPLNLMELCIESLKLVSTLVEKGNRNSISDAGVAALMLQAGGEGAALNVNINLGSLTDADFVEQTKIKVGQYRASLEIITSEILVCVHNHEV